MRRTLALALSLLACARAQAPEPAHGQLLPPPPTMRWYLGANCVGTPGGTVVLAQGCGDYVIFGTVLTIMASLSNVTKQWNIVTFVDAGCRGAIGVLFVNIPHTASGSAPVCIATTTADRCGRRGGGGGVAHSPLPLAPAPLSAHAPPSLPPSLPLPTPATTLSQRSVTLTSAASASGLALGAALAAAAAALALLCS